MSGVSQPVHDLIRTSIDSVETLELLMMLQRSANSFWTAEAAEQFLGIQKGSARARLEGLADSGLLVRGNETTSYRFAPSSDEARKSVMDLATAYANQRVQVINLIYSSNLERLRAFSDAFRIKGKP